MATRERIVAVRDALIAINDLLARSNVIALSKLTHDTPPKREILFNTMFGAILESLENTRDQEITNMIDLFATFGRLIREVTVAEFKQALAEAVASSASPEGWEILLSLTENE